MVHSSQTRSAYNLPPGQREVDAASYNPMADARSDNADYEEDRDADLHLVGARGANDQPTFRDYQREDREAEQSEQTGSIPRGKSAAHCLTSEDSDITHFSGEVDDLLSSTTEEERNVGSYTRGNRVDAYKQERAIDRAFDEAGVANAEQDVEISAAVGRG